MDTGYRVPGGFNADRAFKGALREDDLDAAHAAAESLWGEDIAVIDPMAGGGSIPLEAARLGLRSIANEYNPVACSVLEASVDYPFRFGTELAEKTRKWGRVWIERVEKRIASYFPKRRDGLLHILVPTQWPAGSFQSGSNTMLFGLKPMFFSVSTLSIIFSFFKSITVMEPSLIPGKLRSAFCT